MLDNLRPARLVIGTDAVSNRVDQSIPFAKPLRGPRVQMDRPLPKTETQVVVQVLSEKRMQSIGTLSAIERRNQGIQVPQFVEEGCAVVALAQVVGQFRIDPIDDRNIRKEFPRFIGQLAKHLFGQVGCHLAADSGEIGEQVGNAPPRSGCRLEKLNRHRPALRDFERLMYLRHVQSGMQKFDQLLQRESQVFRAYPVDQTAQIQVRDLQLRVVAARYGDMKAVRRIPDQRVDDLVHGFDGQILEVIQHQHHAPVVALDRPVKTVEQPPCGPPAIRRVAAYSATRQIHTRDGQREGQIEHQLVWIVVIPVQGDPGHVDLPGQQRATPTHQRGALAIPRRRMKEGERAVQFPVQPACERVPSQQIRPLHGRMDLGRYQPVGKRVVPGKLRHGHLGVFVPV